MKEERAEKRVQEHADNRVGEHAENRVRDATVDLADIAPDLPRRIEANPEDIEQGLARLVLTLIEFLRQVLEHQAVRRMDAGGLSDEEIERLGLSLLRLSEKLEEIKMVFGLEGEELNLDLGPLGKLL